MMLRQRMLSNLLLSLKEAAGRGRLDPWVGATFPDRMKLPARPGYVYSFAFKRPYRIAGIFPGVAFISLGGTEPRRIVSHLRLLAQLFPFSLSVPWWLRVSKLLRQQFINPTRRSSISRVG
jgi:hypothetical protein